MTLKEVYIERITAKYSLITLSLLLLLDSVLFSSSECSLDENHHAP